LSFKEIDEERSRRCLKLVQERLLVQFNSLQILSLIW